MQFPASSVSSSGNVGTESAGPIAPDFHRCFTGLVEAALQTNLLTMHAIFRLSSPARFVDLHHRIASDYTAALRASSVALMCATTRLFAQTLTPEQDLGHHPAGRELSAERIERHLAAAE